MIFDCSVIGVALIGLSLSSSSYAIWLPTESKLSPQKTDDAKISTCTLCKLIVENFDNVVENSQEGTICDKFEASLSEKCKEMLKDIVFDSDGKTYANAICAEIDACPEEENDDDDDDRVSSKASDSVSDSIKATGAPPVSAKLVHPASIYSEEATGDLADHEVSSVKLLHPPQIYEAPKNEETEVVEVSITEVYIIGSERGHAVSSDQAYGIYTSSDADMEQGAYLFGSVNSDFAMSFLYYLNLLASVGIIFAFLSYMFGGASSPGQEIVLVEENMYASPPAYVEKETEHKKESSV